MSSDNSLISFIIPVKQPSDLNIKGLESVLSQKFPGLNKEIIIVNNSDETLTLPDLPVTIVHEPRLGPQFARNRGILAARGRYVAFIDCDVILEDNWLPEMMTSLQSGDFWGAQSALVTTSVSKDLFGEFRKLSSEISRNGMIMAEHFFPALNTSACLFDRNKTGEFLFHEDFQKCEDIELSWRLYRKAGCSWIFVPKAKADCFYGSEDFNVFARRNFQLGRYYGGLVKAYSTNYPGIIDWHDRKFFSSLYELGRIFRKAPGLAVLIRTTMSLMYWAGFYLSPKDFKSYEVSLTEKPFRRFTSLNDDILIHDLKSGTFMRRHT